MKAVQVLEAGGPEVLKYMDVDDPTPGPGEALVELKAAGVNYMDVYLRSGAKQPRAPHHSRRRGRRHRRGGG